MNERIIELHDIAPKDFWGAQDAHLETIKKYYPKLKIVARGTTLKAFGEKEELDEFEKRFNRLMVHFTRYNNIDSNVIDRVILNDSREEQRMGDHDKILVHGIGGKLIKPMTPNQQLLVEMMNKNDMVFAVGPAGTGKTYTGVAMAVKALKE
ncbi:PhoH family protein, partial [Flavobacterium sp.]|uniref:PhoH family protein n=1 Tax=Flavobacterium sp. TaxID=239 RepID=UPI00262EBF31